ncbi:hypothetical protein D3C78_1900720 [compost metagenome]
MRGGLQQAGEQNQADVFYEGGAESGSAGAGPRGQVEDGYENVRFRRKRSAARTYKKRAMGVLGWKQLGKAARQRAV